MKDVSEHIVAHSHLVKPIERVRRNGHKPALLWFTGLSGSGKSTLASGLEKALFDKGMHTTILDGDNIRQGLCRDLDFSANARTENIRRIAEVAKLFVDTGVVVLTAFISPFELDRVSAKNIVGEDNFFEIFVDCPLEVCESRDTKGLYKLARSGKISDFSGISSPFEPPKNPSLRIATAETSLEDCLQALINHIEPKLRL